MTPLSINIIGSGSMGHLWTAYLLDSQVNVRLFARQGKSSHPLRVQSPSRSFNCEIVHHCLADWRKPDFIIVSVKAMALESLCIELKTMTQAHPPLILMMNGMGLIEIAQQHLPDTLIYQASMSHGAHLENSYLKHTGQGETLIGDIDPEDPTEQKNNPITLLIDQLNRALPVTRWHANHIEALWTKLLVNSIINPLTAIHQVQNGELLANENINQQAKRLTQQLAPVIQHYLPTQSWQSIFEKVEVVANQTYTNVSSMRQDILLGRKTEIDFISGYLLDMAAKKQIYLPEHEQIVKQIKTLEKQSEHSHNSVTL